MEQTSNALMEELGCTCASEFYGKVGSKNPILGNSTFETEATVEVILVPRLRLAIEKLNPGTASDAVGLAMEELTNDRSAMN